MSDEKMQISGNMEIKNPDIKALYARTFATTIDIKILRSKYLRPKTVFKKSDSEVVVSVDIYKRLCKLSKHPTPVQLERVFRDVTFIGIDIGAEEHLTTPIKGSNN